MNGEDRNRVGVAAAALKGLFEAVTAVAPMVLDLAKLETADEDDRALIEQALANVRTDVLGLLDYACMLAGRDVVAELTGGELPASRLAPVTPSAGPTDIREKNRGGTGRPD